MIAIQTFSDGSGWRVVELVRTPSGQFYRPLPDARISQNFWTIVRDAKRAAGNDEEPLVLPANVPVCEPGPPPEINILDAMKAVGIRTLVADEADDIDYWPPAALFFPQCLDAKEEPAPCTQTTSK